MPTKFDKIHMETLLDPLRLETLDPQRVMSLIPIRYYHNVADIGCGPGYFTIPFAKYMFDGKVYAVDIQQEMLKRLKKRLTELRLTNVEMIRSEENKVSPKKIKEGSLDGVFMAFVLHESEDRKAFLKMALSLLQNGGWGAILEWYKKDTEGGPPLKERISEKESFKLASDAGFTFVSQRDLNGKQYLMLLKK